MTPPQIWKGAFLDPSTFPACRINAPPVIQRYTKPHRNVIYMVSNNRFAHLEMVIDGTGVHEPENSWCPPCSPSSYPASNPLLCVRLNFRVSWISRILVEQHVHRCTGSTVSKNKNAVFNHGKYSWPVEARHRASVSDLWIEELLKDVIPNRNGSPL